MHGSGIVVCFFFVSFFFFYPLKDLKVFRVKVCSDSNVTVVIYPRFKSSRPERGLFSILISCCSEGKQSDMTDNKLSTIYED